MDLGVKRRGLAGLGGISVEDTGGRPAGVEETQNACSLRLL
jgi:hypothetical protein